MAEKYSFFNAEQNSSGEYDRVYLAEDIAAYFASFIGTGVYANRADNLKVFASDGMNIQVKSGKGWIKGYYYENDSDLGITLDIADGAQNRIDTIVLRLDLTNRYIKTFVKKGTLSGSPIAPALIRNADIWELQLASIYVKAGAAEITDSDITDTRMDSSLCGIVKGVVEEIDTSGLFAQYDDEFNNWFETIKGQLSGDLAGNLQTQINNIVEGTTIPASGIATYIHSKEGTVHNFQGSGANGKALLTANFEAGDSITVNGEPVTAYMGAENAIDMMVGSEYSGKWVSFTLDGDTLNFKGGGGKVIVSGLSAEVVKQGTTVTVKQGTKTIASVTGTLPDGNAAKKIAVGERITDTYATIYANYAASNTSGFAQASGNGIKVNEAGRYAVSLVAGSAYANGKSACTLTITRPGMSTVTQQKTLKVVNILWEGELPAGSVVTGVSTVSGGGNSHGITMTIVK